MSNSPGRPRYQVFLSSTFQDLREQRAALMSALLHDRFIPVGMEGFTATADRGWKTIKRTIESSDYYVLLVAGRYGSLVEGSDVSWTEREYEYAREQGLKVLGFIRDDDAVTRSDTELEPDQIARLQKFVQRVRASHLCKTWKQADDLKLEVLSALHNQLQDDEDDDCLPLGWYRGDQMPTGQVVSELARLSAENAALRARISELEIVPEELRVCFVDAPDEDSEVRDVREERPRLVLAPLPAPPSDAQFGSFVGMAKILAPEAFEDGTSEREWLDTLNRTREVHLRLRNPGRRPVNKVVVEITVAPAAEVDFLSPEYPRGTLDLSPAMLVKTPHYENPQEPVYVDGYGATEGTGYVRFRIAQVGGEGDENLYRFYVRVPQDDERGEHRSIRVEVVARSENGVCARTAFTHEVVFTHTEELTRAEARGRGN